MFYDFRRFEFVNLNYQNPVTFCSFFCLSLNPYPRGEGLKQLTYYFLTPFSPGRRGQGG